MSDLRAGQARAAAVLLVFGAAGACTGRTSLGTEGSTRDAAGVVDAPAGEASGGNGGADGSPDGAGGGGAGGGGMGGGAGTGGTGGGAGTGGAGGMGGFGGLPMFDGGVPMFDGGFPMFDGAPAICGLGGCSAICQGCKLVLPGRCLRECICTTGGTWLCGDCGTINPTAVGCGADAGADGTDMDTGEDSPVESPDDASDDAAADDASDGSGEL